MGGRTVSIKWELIGKATDFVAEEMGAALKRSAISPNIRERMDHSCAVVDANGLIVAQAEHIPVHLGSFKVGAYNIIKWMERTGVTIEEGSMLILNDPYISGTHLNDVTVIAPVYYQDRLAAYVINKAHNVDVGGPIPGSLNPSAKVLYDEGFIIPPVKILKNGKMDMEIFSIILENFKDSSTTMGDINAQLAANRMGISRIISLFDKFGMDNVLDAWDKAIQHSYALSRNEISGWKAGEYEAVDYLELGTGKVQLKVKITIGDGKIFADFSGTSDQIKAPLNAVPGVAYSATAFAIRALMKGDIPTNDGFYRTIGFSAPSGCILNPVKPYPVSGGNVETTQRVADVVLLAMSKAMDHEVPAAASGTMMNVMMGGTNNEGKYWAYYETIGGGNGARYNGDGVSGVHSNMTNTLNTPIEVVEMEYPLLFTANKLRDNSGGKGKFTGGDGMIKAFRILSESTISVIGERFQIAPWGLKGGESGKCSKVTIISNGKETMMPGKFTVTLSPGDEVIVETPGGGGYGTPE